MQHVWCGDVFAIFAPPPFFTSSTSIYESMFTCFLHGIWLHFTLLKYKIMFSVLAMLDNCSNWLINFCICLYELDSVLLFFTVLISSSRVMYDLSSFDWIVSDLVSLVLIYLKNILYPFCVAIFICIFNTSNISIFGISRIIILSVIICFILIFPPAYSGISPLLFSSVIPTKHYIKYPHKHFSRYCSIEQKWTNLSTSLNKR